jgi:centrin-3
VSLPSIATFGNDWNLEPSVRQAMIDEFDLDQDGEINEQEFFAIMMDDA